MPAPTYYDSFGYKPKRYGDSQAVMPAPGRLDAVLAQEAVAEENAKREKYAPGVTALPEMSGIDRPVPAVEPGKIDKTKGVIQNQTGQQKPAVGDTPSGVLDGLIRPASAEEQSRRERAYAARQGISGLGNSLAALANVLYTGKGATPQQIPSTPDQNSQQLMSWQDRLMQDRYRQAEMDIAAQRQAADDAYRQWQQRMTEEQAARDKEDRDWERRFKESEAAREQKNIETRNAETERSNRASEATARIRAEKSGSGSGSGGSKTGWHPLVGFQGDSVDVNDTMLSNKTGYTAIGNNIPGAFKQDWKRAQDDNYRKSKAEIVQEAMQKDKAFQDWMIKHGYARLSDVQDDNILDLGGDEDEYGVFDGRNFI